MFFPYLKMVLVGRVLGLEGGGRPSHFHAAAAAGHVLDIWQLGDEEYNRHPGLPHD
jgi:hypothetical protein